MRLVLTTFLLLLLTSEAHALEGPAIMGLMLAMGGLMALLGLIAIIAALLTLVLPKQARPGKFFRNIILLCLVSACLAVIDFLVFPMSANSAVAQLPIYGRFIANFLEGLIFGRLLIELIIVSVVLAVIMSAHVKANNRNS